MPEIFPSLTPRAGAVGTPPNIDRCWTCRSMFMQAWGHYGTAWAVVHQQLGVRPDLGHGRLEVMPQVPDGQPSVSGADIRLGRGSADVHASHDGARYTTVTDTGDVRLRTLQVGHTLPHGAEVDSVVLDGRAVEMGGARDEPRARGAGRGRSAQAPHAGGHGGRLGRGSGGRAGGACGTRRRPPPLMCAGAALAIRRAKGGPGDVNAGIDGCALITLNVDGRRRSAYDVGGRIALTS